EDTDVDGVVPVLADDVQRAGGAEHVGLVVVRPGGEDGGRGARAAGGLEGVEDPVGVAAGAALQGEEVDVVLHVGDVDERLVREDPLDGVGEHRHGSGRLVGRVVHVKVGEPAAVVDVDDAPHVVKRPGV